MKTCSSISGSSLFANTAAGHGPARIGLIPITCVAAVWTEAAASMSHLTWSPFAGHAIPSPKKTERSMSSSSWSWLSVNTPVWTHSGNTYGNFKMSKSRKRSPPKTPTVVELLRPFRPCAGVALWARQWSSPQEAWTHCKRGDWMLGLLARFAGAPESEERKKLVPCSCHCVALALPLANDPSVAQGLLVAWRWVQGQATLEELRSARIAAMAVAKQDLDANATRAATCVAFAAVAAVATAYEDMGMSAATGTIAAVTMATAFGTEPGPVLPVADVGKHTLSFLLPSIPTGSQADIARIRCQWQCAEIIRRYYPEPPPIDKDFPIGDIQR